MSVDVRVIDRGTEVDTSASIEACRRAGRMGKFYSIVVSPREPSPPG